MVDPDHRHTPRGEFACNAEHRPVAANNDRQVNGRIRGGAGPTDDRFDIAGMLDASDWSENLEPAFLKKNFNPVKGLLDSA
jgi:hypothetical protein